MLALDKATVQALRQRRAEQNEERPYFRSEHRDTDLVFTWEDGRPIHPDVVRQPFERFASACGLPRIRLHDIRHNYATAALKASVHTKIVSQRLRHASAAFTLSIYTHAIPGMDRDAADIIATLVVPSDDEPLACDWIADSLAGLALLVTAGNVLWQVRAQRRASRPDIVIHDADVPGAHSWTRIRDGQFTGSDSAGVYLAGTIHVSGSATIVKAGMAPADPEGKPIETPDVYVGDADVPDAGRREAGMGIAQSPDEWTQHQIPIQVTDRTLVIRVEHARPLPTTIREQAGARLRIRTSSGHDYTSQVARLRDRYRGPHNSGPDTLSEAQR